jgi:tripartite-type tricarboxylate transporter receptor subunit TctC
MQFFRLMGIAALTFDAAAPAPAYAQSYPMPMARIKAGRVRPLAVSTAKRITAMPDVPTLQESGLAGFEAEAWFALFAPKDTPPAIIASLNRMFNGALTDPATVAKLSQAGLEATPSTPGQLARTVRSENEKWGRIIKARNIRLDF